MLYSISYDLMRPDQNYQGLWATLESLGGKRILQSHWVVRIADTNAQALRDHLTSSGLVDSNDRLMIIPLNGVAWAGWNLLVDPNTM